MNLKIRAAIVFAVVQHYQQRVSCCDKYGKLPA